MVSVAFKAKFYDYIIIWCYSLGSSLTRTLLDEFIERSPFLELILMLSGTVLAYRKKI